VVFTVLLSEHSALFTPRAFISQIIRVSRVTAELLEHVCRAGARFLQRRGAGHTLPASPRMQGWRRRRSVLVASALHQTSGPSCRRLVLRLDPHSLGSTLREGNRKSINLINVCFLMHFFSKYRLQWLPKTLFNLVTSLVRRAGTEPQHVHTNKTQICQISSIRNGLPYGQ